ncbi:ATP-binding protein [Streptomyces chumphonensis]|uniref:ATP-binding protein n=1 Tax=Streptomyces chumphonensis TaxID=1214925 RepID=A0A927F3I3_9ACTN|nr:ATP-binding protein [Streptomyces chumphonensis]MBD3933636.1 ATP-binding protein [Streptomyces chumphonensis]
MSFTRRIAKSALLTAAGAASVVGAAAGSAQAAPLPATPTLGGLSTLDSLDGQDLGGGVDGAVGNVSELAGAAGSEAVAEGVPAAGRTVGALGKSALPIADGLADEASAPGGDMLGKAVSNVTEDGLPTDALPTDKLTGNVPLGEGSLAGLPL